MLSERQGIRTYENKRKAVRNSIKNPGTSFKASRIDNKNKVFRENYDKPHVPNALELREGYHINPLIDDNIQIGNMRKDENIEQVRLWLQARIVQFGSNTNCTDLLRLLKYQEGK